MPSSAHLLVRTVPSSISSSEPERETPGISYGRIWGVAGCLLALLLTGAEVCLRTQGHLASVTDDLVLWSHERAKVYPSDGRRSIALLGASRIQLGVDPAVLARGLPGTRPVCLAVDGHSPFSLLEDLAVDDQFKGIVVYSATPAAMATGGLAEWIAYYHDGYKSPASLDERLDLIIRLLLQEHFVVAGFWANIRRQLGYGFRIPLDHIITRRDRYRQGWYYDRMSEGERQKRRSGRLLPPNRPPPPPSFTAEQFEEILTSRIAPLVVRLREHGGDIAFLHMPMPDRHPEVASYPRQLFWDRVGPLTGAVTIHPDDYEELSGFYCPDGSHLDARDAVLFTEALAEVQTREGLVGGAANNHQNHVSPKREECRDELPEDNVQRSPQWGEK